MNLLKPLRPTLIQLNQKSYFNAKLLKEYDPVFFIGTSRSIKGIIKKKNILTDNFHYATNSKKFGWRSCIQQGTPPTKATLLLLESWVVSNIPKMIPDAEETKEMLCEYPEAPTMLYLEDTEKFKDCDGNPIDIETRGDRTPKGIYFSAKDVSRVFEMPEIIKTLNNKNSAYEKNNHYNIYMAYGDNIPDAVQKKEVFITYKGMLKILFSSRSGNAEKFIDWATETLFTAQMGTEDKKEELGAKLIGQSVKNIRAVFKTCSKKVPCIYRFSLGSAKDLRVSLDLPENIKDNFTIIKYGLTKDIERRSSEHVQEYEKIPGVKLRLIGFSYIDPKFLYQAEVDIKDYFHSVEIPVGYKSYKELVAINPDHEKLINKQFDYIGTEYQGSITELIIQIEKLKLKLTNLAEKHEWELKDKDRIIEYKNIEIEKKNMEIENCKLKNELLEMKIKNMLNNYVDFSSVSMGVNNTPSLFPI
jgi:hypothetical protein